MYENMDLKNNISDSGERESSSTGGLREPDEGKGMHELISPYGVARVARWYELGAKKYAPRNWEKGVSPNRCFRCIMRHSFKYIAGWKDEDHLAAIAWNALAIMHFEQILHHMSEKFQWDIETRHPDNDPAVEHIRKTFPYHGIIEETKKND